VNPSRLELLQGMPIFGALSEATLRLLLAPSPVREVAAGAAFFHEGEPADCMYVLERGRVAVVKHWQGQEWRLGQLGAGDCFGEMALMDLVPRSATVRALEDCLALVLTPADLQRLAEHDLEQFALVQMNIGREVCRRLRATDELLFRLRVGDAVAVGEAPLRTT
jgi:CRP-like cAMP-binding protein